MTTVDSSVVGLAGESYSEEKGRVPDDSEPQVGNGSTSSSDPETKLPEEDAAPVRTVTGIKVRTGRMETFGSDCSRLIVLLVVLRLHLCDCLCIFVRA
jgi:hypothetical protein